MKATGLDYLDLFAPLIASLKPIFRYGGAPTNKRTIAGTILCHEAITWICFDITVCVSAGLLTQSAEGSLSLMLAGEP